MGFYFFRTNPFFNSKEIIQPISNHNFEKEIRRFSQGIRIPTVSNQIYEDTDFKPFDDFLVYLKQSYALVFKSMESGSINKYSIVLKWKGKNDSLNPLLLLSHYDVVPASKNEAPTESQVFDLSDNPVAPVSKIMEHWEYHPFSGAVTKSRIYGRGTLDMKCMFFALLDAAERLIDTGFTPERDVYFAFGHDEEVGGLQGATIIAEDFKEKGIRFEAVYDEGGIVAASGTGGIHHDMALIGLAEKGACTLKIKVKGLGGHSSMPPVHSALGLASIIISRLEKNQMKALLIPPVEKFLQNVASVMDFKTRMAVKNKWLFKPILLKSLSKKTSTNALVRTTTAVTMAKGSDAANILPAHAEIVVNFRILPGNAVADVHKHVEKQCKGFDVEITSLGEMEPSAVSPDNVKSYYVLKRNIEKFFPDAIITPYVTIAATDSRKYEIVSDNIYRFMPILLNENEQRSMHNFNEYISIENYTRMILFFEELMRNYDAD